MTGARVVTAALWREMSLRRATGESVKSIAAEYGISAHALQTRLSNYGIAKPRVAVLAVAKR